MNATNTKNGASGAVMNEIEGKRFYIPSGNGMCVVTLHLKPEILSTMIRSEKTVDSDPGKVNQRKNGKQLVRVLLNEGKPIDGRTHSGGGLRVVYLPKGEVYNPKKHGNGVRYNRFFHKPLKTVSVE